MNNFTVSSSSPVSLFHAVEVLQGRFDLVRIGYAENPLSFSAEFAPKGEPCGMTPDEVDAVTAKLKLKADALKKIAAPPEPLS
jgi:hypothetical protein